MQIFVKSLTGKTITLEVEGSDTIEVIHLTISCSQLELDSMGLNNEERRYLHILSQYNNQPVRLGTVAMSMGTLPRNLSQTMEPFLFRAGMITKDDKGRMLTPKGYEHIMNNPVQGQ